MKALHRITACHRDGKESVITCEVDPRHAETIVQELGLQGATPLSTFAAKAGTEPDNRRLAGPQATLSKPLVARTNQLAADRLDIQHACRELSTHMADPTQESWLKLKRFGRYSNGKPRLVHRCVCQIGQTT